MHTNGVLELPIGVAHWRDGQSAPELGPLLGVSDILYAGGLPCVQRRLDLRNQRRVRVDPLQGKGDASHQSARGHHLT